MPRNNMMIRRLNREDINLVLEWAADEGWNPGLHDAEAFHIADPLGFWGGYLGNQLVASLSAVRYGSDYAFLGLYIVDPDYRGNGYGMNLWQAVHEALGPTLTGLDGVVHHLDDYARSGYSLSHHNIRFGGRGRGIQSAPEEVRPITEVSFSDLLRYDTSVFGFNRMSFLRPWLRLASRRGLAWVEDDKVRGYGVIRPCRVGYKIGPLFADNQDIAAGILTGLISGTEAKETLYLDVPECNSNALNLAGKFHLDPVFETARMYRNGQPGCDIDRWYGVTTFELG